MMPFDDPDEFVRLALQQPLPEGELPGPTTFDPITLQGVEIPPRKWLVKDWVPMHTVTGLYGDGGVGKSLLGQQLVTGCGIGKHWIGLPVQHVRCLAVFCEDPLEELHRRQHDINLHYGCEFSDLEDIKWMPRMGMDNLLMTFDGARGKTTPFFDEVLAEAKDFGAQLILIDTVADTFGGNENDRSHVRQYVQTGLGQLALAIDGAVMAAAHPSRSGMSTGSGDSGSTGWSNSFRSRAYLSTPKTDKDEPPDPFARTLERMKANYAARDDRIDLRWIDGVFHNNNLEVGILASFRKRSCENAFLELLDQIMNAGQYVADSHQSGDRFAPKAMTRHPANTEKYKEHEFRHAMDTLFASGQIIMSIVKDNRRHDVRCIVRNST